MRRRTGEDPGIGGEMKGRTTPGGCPVSTSGMGLEGGGNFFLLHFADCPSLLRPDKTFLTIMRKK